MCRVEVSMGSLSEWFRRSEEVRKLALECILASPRQVILTKGAAGV